MRQGSADKKNRYSMVVKIDGVPGAKFGLGRLTDKQAKKKFKEWKKFYKNLFDFILVLIRADGKGKVGEFRKWEKIYGKKKLVLALESNEQVVFVYKSD